MSQTPRGPTDGGDPDRPRLASHDESIAVGDQLAVMRAEIDALQIQSVEKGRPWFRQAAVIISLLAFLFSTGATVYANRQAHRIEVASARSDLGQLIQRLYALPRERADLRIAHAQDPATVQALSTLNLTESSILAQQAADIVDRIPEDVSANEYYGVGYALTQVSDYERAVDLYQRGLRIAVHPSMRSNILQSHGDLLFRLGERERGREQMQAALDVHADMPVRQRAPAVAQIHLFWASVEALHAQCRETGLHVSLAQDAADMMAPGPHRDSVEAQIDAVLAGGPCT